MNYPFLFQTGETILHIMERLLDFHHTYMIPAEILLTMMGMTYFTAFKAAYDQNLALMGSNGLVPADRFVKKMKESGKTKKELFELSPSIFWWFECTDENIQRLNLFGMILSAFMVVFRVHNSFLYSMLWLGYHSILSLASPRGNSFYQYGWESQIVETGFLCIFLTSPFGIRPRASVPVIWLFRWLIFRITIGAGLIKFRGDSCWTNKTALHYHFNTQPIPSPLSALFHHLPKNVLSFGVNLDFLVQWYSAPLIMVPGALEILRYCRIAAGVLQSGFMCSIAASGNYSVLNFLTIVPAIALFDDALFGYVPPVVTFSIFTPIHWAMDLSALYIILSRSWPVIKNLFYSRRQLMNASFDNYRLVNTYGAFGSVGKTRNEVIISASHDGETWIEYEFPAKPGDIYRRPCFCAPYHYRLDWNIWFIGFPPHTSYLERRERWLWHFMYKLLKGDELILTLLDAERTKEIYADGPPKFIKADMYRYEIVPMWSSDKAWWKREFKCSLIPELTLKSPLLRDQLRRYQSIFGITEEQLQEFSEASNPKDRVAEKLARMMGWKRI